MFPNTKLELVGFTSDKHGNTQPIHKQRYVANSEPASPSEIKAYMEKLGFEQKTPESYTNGEYLVFDLLPRNVLKDADGDIYVIDSEVKKVKPNETHKKVDSEVAELQEEKNYVKQKISTLFDTAKKVRNRIIKEVIKKSR